MNTTLIFDEDALLHRLHHYLPSQLPLKDFIHHNTLHAFQDIDFHKALQSAAEIFGYKTYLSMDEYRALYNENKISDDVLEHILTVHKGQMQVREWKERLLFGKYNEHRIQRIGQLRALWKNDYAINLEKSVHPILFRLLCSYLDQGISQWKFPAKSDGFLESIRSIERESIVGIFSSNRVKDLLFSPTLSMKQLLHILVEKEELFEQYIFDQQFLHPGWSGMVSTLEHHPTALFDARPITLKEYVLVELLLEIDCIDMKKGDIWKPLSPQYSLPALFQEIESNDCYEVYTLWQEAFEWSYYDQVLKGLQYIPQKTEVHHQPILQAICCIDDRECSFRRYIEQYAPSSETYGVAGFFNLDIYFQPEHSKFPTKVCPAPLTPSVIIVESESKKRHENEALFTKHSHGLFSGWIIAQTLGFWSALLLVKNIFFPGKHSAMVSSFLHMDRTGKLDIERKHTLSASDSVHGYSVEEMAERCLGLLSSIGLTHTFAPIIYCIGHGASSVNNTHYAGYDCGACSGRPGSVNARVAAMIANRSDVRALLAEKGIHIPASTVFIGALHDTTRDEIEYYDTDVLSSYHAELHRNNEKIFEQALHANAKERSRRFLFTNTEEDDHIVHEHVKLRSVSLFEPRPEWNHATNAVCIIGRRKSNKHIFLDRRSFLHSYDYSCDPDGTYLSNILKAVTPVCGGINLEYYFSRVDNSRFGAGSKLPHNVMGLIGVANGMDGDLRTGLPKQMINIHDPLRLLMIVEHYPDIVLNVLKKYPPTYEWYNNNWIHLVIIHPDTKELSLFRDGEYVPYQPISDSLRVVVHEKEKTRTIESSYENLSVYIVEE